MVCTLDSEIPQDTRLVPFAPEYRKFPVNSLLAGNLAFSETSSQLTPPSSGESIANSTLPGSAICEAWAPRGLGGVRFLGLWQAEGWSAPRASGHSGRYILTPSYRDGA